MQCTKEAPQFKSKTKFKMAELMARFMINLRDGHQSGEFQRCELEQPQCKSKDLVRVLMVEILSQFGDEIDFAKFYKGLRAMADNNECWVIARRSAAAAESSNSSKMVIDSTGYYNNTTKRTMDGSKCCIIIRNYSTKSSGYIQIQTASNKSLTIDHVLKLDLVVGSRDCDSIITITGKRKSNGIEQFGNTTLANDVQMACMLSVHEVVVSRTCCTTTNTQCKIVKAVTIRHW